MNPTTHPWLWLALALVALAGLLAWQWWLYEDTARAERAARAALRAQVAGLLAANDLGRAAFRARQQMHAAARGWAGRVVDGEVIDEWINQRADALADAEEQK